MLAAYGITKVLAGRYVLRDVSLVVNRGEAVGLFGPNGAGKTTLYSILIGTARPDRGQILLNDEEISDLPMYQRARRGMSYLPQEPSVFSGLTIEQNILLALETTEPEPTKRQQNLDALLEEFGIAHVRGVSAKQVSSGERRRCEVARTLASAPSYILLDEPLAGIDPIAAAEIGALLRLLTDRGIGVLITDHSIREALRLVDRAYVLDSGSILMEGGPDAVKADPDVRRVYLGTDFFG